MSKKIRAQFTLSENVVALLGNQAIKNKSLFVEQAIKDKLKKEISAHKLKTAYVYTDRTVQIDDTLYMAEIKKDNEKKYTRFKMMTTGHRHENDDGPDPLYKILIPGNTIESAYNAIQEAIREDLLSGYIKSYLPPLNRNK